MLPANLSYDEAVFAASCQSIGQGTESEAWSRNLSVASGPEEILADIPPEMQLRFLTAYLRNMSRSFAI